MTLMLISVSYPSFLKPKGVANGSAMFSVAFGYIDTRGQRTINPITDSTVMPSTRYRQLPLRILRQRGFAGGFSLADSSASNRAAACCSWRLCFLDFLG